MNGVETTVDKTRPAWAITAGTYYNRLLGLSIAIPEHATILTSLDGKPAAVSQGEVPPGNVSPFLVAFSLPAKNADLEMQYLFISEGNGSASDVSPYIEQAVKLMGYPSLDAYLKQNGALGSSPSFTQQGRNVISPLR